MVWRTSIDAGRIKAHWLCPGCGGVRLDRLCPTPPPMYFWAEKRNDV